jgi:glutamate formiminotransferase
VASLDLRSHTGVHPRLGVVDVVPFVPVGAATIDDAIAHRDDFARWLADAHGVPAFVYGPERSLPDVRRHAFVDLRPDHGPAEPHPTAGATAVGARPLLVAYNVWLDGVALDEARVIARAIRSPEVRALAFAVEDTVQVSMNLVQPLEVGPAAVYDLVAAAAPIRRAELVGLVPDAVRSAIPRARWAELDLDGDRTIEARLEAAGHPVGGTTDPAGPTI